MTAATPEPLDTYAVVEAMGHRTLIGRITEATIAGKAMLHVATIAGGEHYLPPESLYCLTPCTQEQAERANSRHWGGLPPALAALTAGTGDGPAEDALHHEVAAGQLGWGDEREHDDGDPDPWAGDPLAGDDDEDDEDPDDRQPA
jgi:hypothetical protein